MEAEQLDWLDLLKFLEITKTNAVHSHLGLQIQQNEHMNQQLRRAKGPRLCSLCSPVPPLTKLENQVWNLN